MRCSPGNAERLCTVTEPGTEADLRRQGKDVNDPSFCREQVKWSIAAFRKERKLYDESLESFCDEETFFRTRVASRSSDAGVSTGGCLAKASEWGRRDLRLPPTDSPPRCR